MFGNEDLMILRPILTHNSIKKGDMSAHLNLIESIENHTLFFPVNAELPEEEIDAYKSALERLLCTQDWVFEELIKYGGLALLTSGSTGEPKLALFSWNRLLRLAELQAKALDISVSSMCLLSLPLYHIAGVMARLRAYVAKADITSDVAEATHISWVPTQLMRYLKAPFPLPKLHSLLIGGAPVCFKLKKQARQRGLPLFESYGLTEAGALVCLDGKPASSINVRIREGEVELKGGLLFLGYLDRSGQLFEHCPDAWFQTGDLGEFDALGVLNILGRRDNLFISGGENIQPEEIENALMQHPCIDFACVVPIEDPEFGKRPVAFVHSSEHLETADVYAFLETKLIKFKWPVKFFPWPQHVVQNKSARLELKRRVLEEL